MAQRRPPAPPLRLNPAFKLAVFLAFTLTLVFLAVAVYLSTLSSQTPAIEKMTEACSTLVKIGAGAIFGLVTGKRVG